MKRYELQRCDGYDSDCNAEMMETSLGDYVDAVESINEIARLKTALERIIDEADEYDGSPANKLVTIAITALGRGL